MLLLVRVSTWKSVVYTVNICCLCGIESFCPLPELRPKSWGYSLFLFSLPSVKHIPSRVTDTSNANCNSAWEMPRALIYFISIFVFSKVACSSDSQSHRETEALCPTGNKSPPKPLNSYEDLHLFYVLEAWVDLYLVH